MSGRQHYFPPAYDKNKAMRREYGYDYVNQAQRDDVCLNSDLIETIEQSARTPTPSHH